ncbi:MAG: system killer suppression protein [Candidatus Marinimicrobia bacterium]|nr:system killer suppression protein [Candidatus Neomarinimicrobiota bacterium]
MDIDFKTSKLSKVFNSEKNLNKAYGKQRAKAIMRRMAVLRGAPSLADVPHQKPERRHQLTGNRKGKFAVDITRNERIVFLPNHNPVPTLDVGGIDLEKITAVKIIAVEDYH